MTLEEFNVLVDSTEAGVLPPQPSEVLTTKKHNGMSTELAAFLDGLSSPNNMEAAIQSITSGLSPTPK